jgi:hypothetical protein
MQNIQTWKTASGVAMEKIAALLAEIFADADKAYKAVPGGADLTDINTGHMIERVTQVFGIKGFGWNFRWAPDDLVFIGDLAGASARCTAHLKNAVFSYCLLDEAGAEHWFEIQTSGMNTNSALYAEEGARTTALGAALKGLCFQLPIYKGYLDHHNAQAVATQMAAQRTAAARKVASEETKGEPKAAVTTAASATTAATAAANPAAEPAPASMPTVHTPGKNGASARPTNGASAKASDANKTPAAKPAAVPTATATIEAPAAPVGDEIPERLPDGVDVEKFIDGLADKINLDEFVLPPGSNVSGQKLAAQNDARIRWYAYSMRGTNPRAMVLKVLAYRLLQRKNLLQAGDKHPLAG